MDSVIDMQRARKLVSDATWPLVRDFLWDFAPQIHPSRIPEGFPNLAGKSPRIKRHVLEMLEVAPVFHDFPPSDNSRLLLLDSGTLDGIAKWLGTLVCAASLRKIMDGAKVRALKAALPETYPAVFSYTAYFPGFDGLMAGAFDGLNGDEVVAKVIETGYGLFFSFLTSLPDGLMQRLILKLPSGVSLDWQKSDQTVKLSHLHKILKLKFPEAYALCCS